MPNLRVGTITACYNGGKYFKDCLNGLLSQTQGIDFITIIDDASTDDSILQIKETIQNRTYHGFQQFHNYELTKVNEIPICLFRLPVNKGPAAARNIGLKFLLDQVDVICVADIDDILYPEKIEKSIIPMLRYAHVGLVYSDYDVWNEKTGTITREFKEPFSINRLMQECIVSNNSVYATSIIKQVGLYDENIRGPEDYDLWIRIAEKAAVYHIPEALYKYRISGNNLTITTPPQEFDLQRQKVFKKAIERRRIK